MPCFSLGERLIFLEFVMAITLLSPSANLAPSAAAANASMDTAANTTAATSTSTGLTFANLFSRQLGSALPGIDNSKASNGESLLPTSSDTSETEGSTGDLAALLAAAGLIPQTAPGLPNASAASTTAQNNMMNVLAGSKQGGQQDNGLLQQLNSLLGQQGKASDSSSGNDLAALLESTSNLGTANSAATPSSNTETGFAEALAAQQAQQQLKAPANETNPPGLPVSAPVSSPKWSQEVGEHMVWMSKNETQQAQLTLNPPHLGPVQVSLSLNNEHLTAQFVAASPEVRQALEESLPRLKEMLAESGIQLGQANVGSESFRQQQGFADNTGSGNREASRLAGDNAILGTPLEAASHTVSLNRSTVAAGNGRLDLFV
jgi:flagellar hook-length control protein FliK